MQQQTAACLGLFFFSSMFAAAARIPLSDKALPFLSIDSVGAGILRWDSAALLDAMQGAAMVEVSPRGLRFIPPEPPTFFGFQPSHRRTTRLAVATDAGGCVAAPGCLCAMPEGLLLPSPILSARF